MKDVFKNCENKYEFFFQSDGNNGRANMLTYISYDKDEYENKDCNKEDLNNKKEIVKKLLKKIYFF